MTLAPLFAGVKSRILEHVPLNNRTTWRIGGTARWLATPSNREELAQIWGKLPADIPRFILGGGSNILVEDCGFSGVAVDLRQQFNKIGQYRKDGETVITAEAGVSTSSLAHYARQKGLTGAEFLGGIPGTIGGAVRMNAGANGGDIASILLDAQLLDQDGELHVWPAKKLGLSYRQSKLPKGWIFIKGSFKLKEGDTSIIRERMREFNQQRRKSQPLNFPSAGSTFKNPAEGPAAWKLIHEAGLRGARVGDAQVSEKHSNFLINLGQAKSCDMLSLIDHVREQVVKNSGTTLNLEVAILGNRGFRPAEV
ncbi:MAG: UDP-N-acetylmuramate dehydrogenase [Magnetococcales bacterium]|nr:UDP-N-acetylmuramate dehydrogenase [Magnetococcales bacterium]